MKTAYHQSAILHATGKATFIDDIPKFPQELHGHVVYSPVAHGILKSFDLSQALKVPGVITILSHKDIPGSKKIGAVTLDEPVLVQDEISYIGQPLFLIAAENEQAALQAQKLIKYEIQELEPIVTIEQSMQKDWKLEPTRKIERGDLEKGFKNSDYIIEGTFRNGAQEHWYLETQIAIALPGELNEMKILSSTQNPTEIQALVAEVLGINFHEVEVETRRLGGGFGGKETQAAYTAVWAALLAWHTKRPVRMRLERKDDQLITGKRHPFFNKYKVGFDKNGKIIAADIELNGNAGAFADLSMAILERAMLHAENAYYIPNIRIRGTMWRTNLPPNTAFRGFGGPQGIANIENIVQRIAHFLRLDPAMVRKINFYDDQHNITPYGQKVENNRLHIIFDKLTKKANYFERRQKVIEFNKTHKYVKRGIALVPVKFGISFTASFLNQAGALVLIYTDGSVQVNHGGIEMGQGLYTKIRQIAAAELGVSYDKIKITPTTTGKVPNTPPTAASTGSDLNGMAVKDAIDKLKKRISTALADYFNEQDPKITSKPEDFVFENDLIYDAQHPERKISFSEAAKLMHLLRVSLSATGYYRTPGVYFDREKGQGHPFYYFAFGMGITELELDLLTGKVKLLRADILHDAGDSLNPQIDIGQIEGAYIQSVGWMLMEDCRYTEKGRLLNDSPGTYKMPVITDIPPVFNVELLQGYPQPGTIRKSKAIGEPPYIHGISAWLAVKDILAELDDFKSDPDLDIPATHDKIVLAVNKKLFV